MSARFLNQAGQHHVQLCGQWARGSDSPNIWWLLMVQDPCVPVCSLTQSCPALCNPMDYSLPGSSVHGILQARILEWVAIPFSRGSPLLRYGTCVSCVSCVGRRVLYREALRESNALPIWP